MDVDEAGADVRTTYRRGSVGQLVSALAWAVSAAVATWGSPAAAPVVLFVGGMLIFLLTTLGLRLLGGPSRLPAGHPMAPLALQTALQVPLGLLVALLLAAYEPRLFFPAAAIVVGAHYLPFAFLYGTRSFLVLAVPMVLGGVTVAFLAPAWSTGVAWATAALLAGFGVVAEVRHRTSPVLVRAR